jgi:hypothetical protein
LGKAIRKRPPTIEAVACGQRDSIYFLLMLANIGIILFLEAVVEVVGHEQVGQ